MRKGINKMVGIRVAAALAAVVLFSFVMTGNIMRIQRSEENAAQADVLLDRAFSAEVAHYISGRPTLATPFIPIWSSLGAWTPRLARWANGSTGSRTRGMR